MKKIKILIIMFILAFSSFFQTTNATEEKIVTRKEIFNYIGNVILLDFPKSYKFIELKFKGIKKDTIIYDNLQKLVYLDVVNNKDIFLYPNKNLSAYSFYKLVGDITQLNFISPENEKALKNRLTTNLDFEFLSKVLEQEIQKQSTKNIEENDLVDFYNSLSRQEQEKFIIFLKSYYILNNDYYYSDKIDKNKLFYSSIEGLTNGTDDKFTSFFPPQEKNIFDEQLSGEFYGIGAYVSMDKAGELKIDSTVENSPAFDSGLKANDIVTKVNGKEITKTMSVNDCVKLIKGPEGTKVELEILRDGKTLNLEIKRAKVTIKDVEYKVLDNGYFYINAKVFGNKITSQFQQAIEEFKNQNTKKLIIDLRNNPGGYLEQANGVLNLFIDKGNPLSIIDYKNDESINKAEKEKIIDLNNYTVYILANSQTASASEILIGTLKDYYPQIKIVGEKTYGKGSVQTTLDFSDGSMIKYTTAKWFTGKTKTGIDGVGISPDIEVKFDLEKLKNEKIDTQLDYILKL